jgi:hypothetical protein
MEVLGNGSHSLAEGGVNRLDFKLDFKGAPSSKLGFTKNF